MDFTFKVDVTLHASPELSALLQGIVAGVSSQTLTAQAGPGQQLPPATQAPAPVAAEERQEEAPVTTAEAPEASSASVLALTEDQMRQMAADDLLVILKDLGIDPNATEGKNTNRKLRELILDWQEVQAGGHPASAAEAPAVEAPKATEASASGETEPIKLPTEPELRANVIKLTKAGQREKNRELFDKYGADSITEILTLEPEQILNYYADLKAAVKCLEN